MSDNRPDRTPFSITQPLPEPGSFTVIEASAGTGKTYAITALAVRLLGDGRMTMDQLLLVTFSRNATAELRDRLHTRLRATISALADPAVRAQREQHDDLLTVWPAAQSSAPLERLRQALADFDKSTIATIHETCARLLDELGILVDHDAAAVHLADLSDVTNQLVVDCYLQVFGNDEKPALSVADARSLATELIQQPDLPIVPQSSTQPIVARRVAFAQAIRDALAQAKRQQRFYTFHDMQARLRDALQNQHTAAWVRERLAARYSTVLVDEFQDTDPVQADILRNGFVSAATVVAIGDPKQAIYGFRGGDVHTYLAATASADTKLTLDRNWRSDASLLTALDALFNQAALGDDKIVVHPSAAQCPSSRLRYAGTPITPLLLHRPLRDTTNETSAHKAREAIAADIAEWVSWALSQRVEYDDDAGPRPLRPNDIAVLVRTRKAGIPVQQALTAHQIPSSFAGADNVLASEAAHDWQLLLAALIDGGQADIRNLALTGWCGWTLPDLAAASEADLTTLTDNVRRWSRLLHAHGIAAVVDAVTADTDAIATALGRAGGERRVTDLRHIGSLLATQQHAADLPPAGLRAWLSEQIAQRQSMNDFQSRRMETDESAVQIRTMHSAKGLEFPVVLLPDLWETWTVDAAWRCDERVRPLVYHRRGDDGTQGRVIDVGGPGSYGHAAAKEEARAEELAEDLRIAYVAATRAQCHLGVWWAPVTDRTVHSPLQRLLAYATPGQVPPTTAPLADHGRRAEQLQQAGIKLRGASPARDADILTPTIDPASLVARRFDREVDTHWRRASYSRLTQQAHDETVTTVADDEPELASPVDNDAEPAALSLMGDLPSGTQFGNLVHALYERVDFTSPDVAADVASTATELLRYWPVDTTANALTDAVVATLNTPLGPLLGGLRLRDIAWTDRRNELDFELAMSPRDRTRPTATIRDIAAILSEYLPADDPLTDYPGRLAELPVSDPTLRGYLTGSIDLVVRLPDNRFAVADYKTNWLGRRDVPLTVTGYAPDALAEAMMTAHYPLQAILYSVALHRFLRWRLDGYEPAKHLAGIAYLFVRGMIGPETPTLAGQPYGVFSWRPPAEAIEALSDLLAGNPTGGTQ